MNGNICSGDTHIRKNASHVDAINLSSVLSSITISRNVSEVFSHS
jgi:hypothetical protein